ncbi:MAG: leucine-rich repeat domain-containing protein, partial [Candidatus Poribacteria bacterium]|nr:leucine-rich repeat domain-containing protein [Candidatus Poribacteria bacterium]
MRTHALHRTVPAIILMTVFFSLCMFPCTGHSQAETDAIVQFADRTLAIMVRIDIAIQNLQAPNLSALKAMPEAEVLQIPKVELAELRILAAGKGGGDDLGLPVITDLTGLEHAAQLTRLYLRNQDVADIALLAHLTELTTIDLWGNHVVDVTPLSGLTKLTSL